MSNENIENRTDVNLAPSPYRSFSKSTIYRALTLTLFSRKTFLFSIFLQVTVEVRDSLRGLGSGVKRSIDDVDSKSYIRAKTRERFEQPKSATSGTVKFVAADTTRPEKESSSNFNEINDISVEKPGSSQELPLTLKTEELDIFAE